MYCLGGVRVEVAGELLAFVVYRRAGISGGARTKI